MGRHFPLMVGRPTLNAPAAGAAPGVELDLQARSALARIRDAGHAGVAIGEDLSVSVAIRLGLTRLVIIDAGSPQRARLKRRHGART